MLQAGDIVNVQGIGIISKLISWTTDCDYTHTAMICCQLRNSEYMVIEMVAQGILIRPFAVYRNNKTAIYRINQSDATQLGKQAVINVVEMIPVSKYDFETLVYLGLILIPRRLWNRKMLSEGVPEVPKSKYQVFCKALAKIISTITLMSLWTDILIFFLKDKWWLFTQNVSIQVECIRKARGDVPYEEFVDIVEKELDYMRICLNDSK